MSMTMTMQQALTLTLALAAGSDPPRVCLILARARPVEAVGPRLGADPIVFQATNGETYSLRRTDLLEARPGPCLPARIEPATSADGARVVGMAQGELAARPGQRAVQAAARTRTSPSPATARSGRRGGANPVTWPQAPPLTYKIKVGGGAQERR